MRIIALVLLLFAVAYEGHLSRYDLHRQYRPSPFSKYRISPKTGVRIALPSKKMTLNSTITENRTFSISFEHLINLNGKPEK